MKMEMTLRQLEIFRTVARARNLTQAAKQLGVAQPSISQQVARLEAVAGVALIDRSQSAFALTEAGAYLLRKAEQILAETDDAAAGLCAFRDGRRAVLSVGAPASFARLVLPDAAARLAARFPDIEFDIHEVAPGEAVDMLYNRQLTVAVLSASAIADNAVSFPQVEIATDDYVLAAPSGIDLSQVRDPDRDLSPDQARIVNALIEFNFGTRHADRMSEWGRRALPRHRVLARTRSYETALALVEAGLGVAVVPALATAPAHVGVGCGASGEAPRAETRQPVRLWRTTLEPRRLVALAPSQYVGAEPCRSFLRALKDAATARPGPEIATAPFLLDLARASA